MSVKKYYAVKNGRKIGIFETWKECQEQTLGFKNAVFKSFTNLEDAEDFIAGSNLSLNKEDKIQTKDEIFAYIDGSYNKATQTSGFGLAFVKNGEIIYEDKKAFPNHQYNEYWNVFGEIKGAEEALRVAISKGYKSICLVYDYQGIERWATGEWKANNDLTKEYQRNIKDFSEYISINFKKVKSHASVEDGGDEMNEYVDKLAKESVGI